MVQYVYEAFFNLCMLVPSECLKWSAGRSEPFNGGYALPVEVNERAEDGFMSGHHTSYSVRPQYIPRFMDSRLRTELEAWPAVVITGPRGVGKTTTALQVVESDIDLSQPQQRQVFMLDMESALRAAPKPVLLDEWQQAPDSLWVVKRLIDQEAMSGFVIAGSTRIRSRIGTESNQWPLVHRGVTLELHPLTVAEKRHLTSHSFIERLTNPESTYGGRRAPGLYDYIDLASESGYPAYFAIEDQSERRARMENAVRDMVRLDAATGRVDHRKMLDYLHAYAANSSGLVNQTTLAERAGVSRASAERYEQALHDSYIVTRLPSWHRTFSSRTAKRSKRFVSDTGVWAAILGVGPGDIRSDPKLIGALMETFVLSQVRARASERGSGFALYHYRDQAGREIDLLLENRRDRRLFAIEVKASAAVTRRDARHLEWLRDQLDRDTRRRFRFARGVVLYTGPATARISDRVWAMPISALWE